MMLMTSNAMVAMAMGGVTFHIIKDIAHVIYDPLTKVSPVRHLVANWTNNNISQNHCLTSWTSAWPGPIHQLR